MNKTQKQVLEFHKVFEIDFKDKPEMPDADRRYLRLALIQEELNELTEALGWAPNGEPLPEAGNFTEAVDAIGDLLYVVYGTAIELGVDMEPIMDEIHRSNMSKVGGHKADNGKWIKPDTYSPVNLEPIIEEQRNA